MGPDLASQWTFADAPASSSPPGYSFSANPGNITIDVTALMTLLQETIWTDYLIEGGIFQDGVTQANRFAGLVIQSGVVGTYIEFSKYYDSGTSLPRLRAVSYVAGVPTVIDDIAFAFGSNIVLRIKKLDGVFSFYYKRSTSASFTQTPHTVAASGAYSTAAGNAVGFLAGGDNAPNYEFAANHFYFRSLTDIAVEADSVIQVTSRIAVNADSVLEVVNYPVVRNFVARQYATERLVQLDWDNPVVFDVTKITLQSPDGSVFDIMVDDNGIPETMPSTSTPMAANPIVQASDGSYYTISVSDDGAIAAQPAPGAVFSDSTLIILDSTPSAISFQIYVIVEGLNFYISTKAATATYLGVTLVRNADHFPKTVTDGTVILSGTALNTYLDGPVPGLSRYYYAAFAVYAAKATVPATDSTMPILDSLYKSTGRKRFSRKFLSGPWSQIYSYARLLTTLVDVDIPEAMAQFNLQTATGVFADLWGRIFGSPRFPRETDAKYTSRILNRVLLPRTITRTIISQVLAVPGVFFCDILDSSDASMFIGHSYIGFAGVPGFETQGDSVVFAPEDNPFYFTVRVKIITGTDLAQIIQAINETKEAGTRFSVIILETI